MSQSTEVAVLSASPGQPAEPFSENLQVNNKPLISVVIPTYNRSNIIMAAIESVLAQTYPVFEIIIVDDGSSDGTGNMLQRLINQRSGCGKPAQEIRYFYQSNQGQSAARNKGIAEARGEWIAFMDSDDPWSAEKLEWQVRAITQFKNDCGACLTDAKLSDNLGLNTTAFRTTETHCEQPVGIFSDATSCLAKTFGSCWVQTLVVRTDLVKRAGGFDRDLHFSEDQDFLFRLSLVTKYCYVNMPLVSIDRTNSITDPNAISRRWDDPQFRLQGKQYMYEKWLRLGAELPSDVQRIIVQNLRRVHSAWTNCYLEIGEYEKARQAASRALGYEFTLSLAFKWVLTRVAPDLARRIVPKSESLVH
jgi:glycosyltransferase involved in cell wall biosynthesis